MRYFFILAICLLSPAARGEAPAAQQPVPMNLMGDPANSAVVKLDFHSTVLFVTGKFETAEVKGYCDVAGSSELIHRNRGAAPKKKQQSYEMVATRLADGDKREIVFDVHIKRTKVGAEISVRREGNELKVAIYPKAVLPSGKTIDLNADGVASARELLARELADADKAPYQIALQQKRLQGYQQAYASAVHRAKFGSGIDANAAVAEADEIDKSAKDISEQIAVLEGVQRDRPRIDADAKAVDQIFEYGNRVLQQGSIWIRIYSDLQTIPAEVTREVMPGGMGPPGGREGPRGAGGFQQGFERGR